MREDDYHHHYHHHLPQPCWRVEEAKGGPGDLSSHGGVGDSPGSVLTEAEHHQGAPLTVRDVGELVCLLRHVQGDVIQEAAGPGHDGIGEVVGVEDGLSLQIEQDQFSRAPGCVPGSLLPPVIREPQHAVPLHFHALHVLETGAVTQSLQLPGRESSGEEVLMFVVLDNYFHLMGEERGSDDPTVGRGRTPTLRG